MSVFRCEYVVDPPGPISMTINPFPIKEGQPFTFECESDSSPNSTFSYCKFIISRI